MEPIPLRTGRFIHRNEAGLPADERSQVVPVIMDQDGTTCMGVTVRSPRRPKHCRMFSHLPEDVQHVLPPEQVAKDLARLAKQQRPPEPWSPTVVLALAVTAMVIAAPVLALGFFHLLKFFSR